VKWPGQRGSSAHGAGASPGRLPAGASPPPDPSSGAGEHVPEETYNIIDEQPPVPVEAGGEADFAPAAEPTFSAAEAADADEQEPGSPVAETAEPPGAEQPEAEAGSAAGFVEQKQPARARQAQAEADADEFAFHTGTIRPTNEPDAIEFVDVHKSFGRNQVLRGLNMALPENQISMILGPSGTGKSVCIKHIVGLLYPDQGDVIVHGRSIPSLPDQELFDMRRRFGVLFQDGALFGSLNLYDNVAFPLRQHTEKGEEEIAEIVNRRLNEVGLGNANEKMPNELSGGMRKRAGFARALVLDPDIVLFDEPDSGLDPVRTALLCELIKEIHAENGGCYVVITHDIMSARRVAEHISVLWKGKIVESGPAEELFASENPFVRQFLAGESQGPLGMS
jgi:phospholipid/cholesterol/gamma-HCH transport system ATP-binding protein